MNKTVKTLLLSIMLTAFFCGCGVEFWHPDYVPSTGGGGGSEKHVDLISVISDGTSSQSTTMLILNFSESIHGLSSADINLSGVSGITKGALSGSNPYFLGISGFTTGGSVLVSVSKNGYRISGIQTVTIYYNSNVTNATPVASDYDIYGIGNYTYDGSPKAVSIIPKSGTSSGAITILYNGSETHPSAVGSYTVTFNVAAAPGWNAAVGLVAGTLVISSSSVPVTSVSLNKSSLSLVVSDTETLSATVTPSNATNKSLTWSSSNSAVATVSGGTVTAVSAGSTIITVTTVDGGFTATCSVRISLGIITPANLASYLATLPVNSVSSPHYIALKVTNSDDFYSVSEALNGASNKYVNLNLTGSTINSIVEEAFRFCDSLVGVTIPDSVTSIEESAFAECTSLTSVNIPSSVTSISYCAFYECTSLASVTIGSGVTSIGGLAFRSCYSLVSIIIPNSVTAIGDNAFELCSILASVTIGRGVTSIGYRAFSNCNRLVSVTIPSSVTSIGNQAFFSNSLDNVTFQGTIPSSGFIIDSFLGDLRDKFYASNPSNGTPGTYTTSIPGWGAIWTRK